VVDRAADRFLGLDSRFALVEGGEKRPHSTAVQYDFSVPGLGDVFATWLWHGSYLPYFITSDGLYVGTVLDNTTRVGPGAAWDESMKYFYQAPDGVPYLINGGNQQAHLMKLTGLEKGKVGRFEVPYQITEQDVKSAAEMREVPEVKPMPKAILNVAWADPAPKIDGNGLDWDFASGVSLDGGNGRSAEVVLRRDRDNLYLAYKVHKGGMMVNGGADWRQLFITGDCVDLMLACDPKASAQRREAAPGDVRLLFSLYDGKPIAVVYKPVVSGTTQAVQFMGARIDEVRRLDSAKVAIRQDAGEGTYTVEAAVPLKDLGLDGAGGEYVGDVGVIYADETGKSRALRLYYYNKKTQMTADLTTEATLQPKEWGALHLAAGPNLLKNGGFEGPLVDSDEEGWRVVSAVNGNVAGVTNDIAFSGHGALLLQTVKPVTFPSEVYDNPDYEVFRKSANGGAGGGVAEVRQKVPVVPGHRYNLSYHYRSEDFMPERKQPGHPRGHITFYARLEWVGSFAIKPPAIELDKEQDSLFEWQTAFNPNKGVYGSLPAPYVAPEGATGAYIILGLKTLTADKLPKLYVDDCELVDVPGE